VEKFHVDNLRSSWTSAPNFINMLESTGSFLNLLMLIAHPRLFTWDPHLCVQAFITPSACIRASWFEDIKWNIDPITFISFPHLSHDWLLSFLLYGFYSSFWQFEANNSLVNWNGLMQNLSCILNQSYYVVIKFGLDSIFYSVN
jgi:hypothetical protein